MKLIHKLILGFLSIALLSWLAGIYIVHINKKELQDLIVKDTETLLFETLDKIDRHINTRIELFEEYSRDLMLITALQSSNREFGSLIDREEYLQEMDYEWTTVPAGEISHFMEGVLKNDLSRSLRKKASFYEQRHGYRIFGEIFVTNRFGANIAQTGKTTDYRQDDEEWWQRARMDGRYVEDVDFDESAGVYSIDIALAVNDENDDFAGVMKVVLNVQEIIGMMSELKTGVLHEKHRSMKYYLISQGGKLLYASQRDRRFLEDVSHLLPQEGQLTVGGEEKRKAGSFFIREGGRKILVSHAQSRGFELFQGLNWNLVLQHTAEEIFAPASRLRNRMLISSFALILVGFIIAYVVSHSVTVNVRKFQKAVARIGKGYLDTEIDVTSHDEIGQLARAFKKMTNDLKTTIISRDRLAEEIKQRKKVEVRFEESKQDWEDTFNTITDIITIHDKDFNIVRANRAAEEILGLPDLKVNKVIKCFQYYHGRDCPPESCPSCECLKTKKPASNEIFEPHLDKYIEVRAMPRLDANNQMIGLIHVVRDVTDRRRIEEAIKRGRAEWEMTFDNTSEFIILVDKDGRIVRCNRSFSDFIHTPIEEITGMSCTEVVPIAPEQLRAGSPPIKVEVMTTNREWLYLSSCPILNEQGEHIRTVIVGTDITSLKYTEEKLLKSEEQLKKKVEDLENFYNMAIGRELKMKELKKEIKKLQNDLASLRKYDYREKG